MNQSEQTAQLARATSTLVMCHIAAIDSLVSGSARETLGHLERQIAIAESELDRGTWFELIRFAEQLREFTSR